MMNSICVTLSCRPQKLFVSGPDDPPISHSVSELRAGVSCSLWCSHFLIILVRPEAVVVPNVGQGLLDGMIYYISFILNKVPLSEINSGNELIGAHQFNVFRC